MSGVSEAGLRTTRVPGDERGGRHPREDRVREVPRRDHGAGAERDVERLGKLARVRRDGDLAAPAEHLAGVELEEVDRLGGLDVGLGPGLPDLENHRGGEIVLARPHAGGRAQEDGRALPRREISPLALRLDGRVNRLEGDLAIGEMVTGEHLRAVGGVHVLEETAGLDPPSTHDEGDLHALLRSTRVRAASNAERSSARLKSVKGSLRNSSSMGGRFYRYTPEGGSVHDRRGAEGQTGRGRDPLRSRRARGAGARRRPLPVSRAQHSDGPVPARLDEIPKDRTVVCACRSGSRSAHIAAYLRTHGRDAVNLDGGILAWSARSIPRSPRTEGTHDRV